VDTSDKLVLLSFASRGITVNLHKASAAYVFAS
jgi:hypothetical protein